MEKDRDKRYANAAEMKADLQRLRKETESGLTRTGARETSPMRVVTKTFQSSSKPQSYLLIAVTALLVTVLAAVGTWWIKHRAGSTAAGNNNAIAVLPLQNLNGDFSVDYLRFALADEIANVLTYSRTLDVRPSSATRKYVSADLDAQKVGHELHVATMLTGHFMKQGTHLLVTLQAIQTGSDRVLWQTNLNGSTQDLISLQQALAKQVRTGLLPMLGAAGGFLEASTRPSNQEAYDLYLRSVAAPPRPYSESGSHPIAGKRGAVRSELRSRLGRNWPASAIRPSLWPRGIISSAPAPGPLWSWVNLREPSTLSSLTQAPSGLTTLLLPFCYGKAGCRKPAKR